MLNRDAVSAADDGNVLERQVVRVECVERHKTVHLKTAKMAKHMSRTIYHN